MQHLKPLRTLTVLACSATLFLGGCQESPENTGVAPLAAAPAGFEKIRDVSALPVGTVLYNGDGTPFGTVQGHEPVHDFLNGKKEKGTKLVLASAAPAPAAAKPASGSAAAPPPPAVNPPFWLPDSLLASTKCVKK